MATFRNNEGDLPPLIPTGDTNPTAAPARTFSEPSFDRTVQVDPGAVEGLPTLPTLPELVPQLPDSSPQPPAPVPAMPPMPEPQPQPYVQPELPPVQPEATPQPSEPIPVQPEIAPVQPEQQQPEQSEQGGFLRRRSNQQDDQSQQQQQVSQPAQQAQPKSHEREEIEKMLSAGLSELYQTMTPEQQQQFRTKGDETATAIEQMVSNFKATTRKVLGLIRGWLQVIPGVNKYFLEQESKLKTDEIMKYQRKLKKQKGSRITL